MQLVSTISAFLAGLCFLPNVLPLLGYDECHSPIRKPLVVCFVNGEIHFSFVTKILGFF